MAEIIKKAVLILPYSNKIELKISRDNTYCPNQPGSMKKNISMKKLASIL